jgi:hypothetical protein
MIIIKSVSKYLHFVVQMFIDLKTDARKNLFEEKNKINEQHEQVKHVSEQPK